MVCHLTCCCLGAVGYPNEKTDVFGAKTGSLRETRKHLCSFHEGSDLDWLVVSFLLLASSLPSDTAQELIAVTKPDPTSLEKSRENGIQTSAF